MRHIRSRYWGGRYCALVVLVVALWSVGMSPVWAGTTCTQAVLQPEALANAARLGTQVFAVLEPTKIQVALLGRVGADLSSYGLRFSHLGFVVRDSARRRWTVVHLLNRCGTATSSLYDEGLINFFLDDPFSYEAVLAIPDASTQQALRRALNSALVWQLHEAHYNTIAQAHSLKFQNSNQWVLELAVAALAKGAVQSRSAAHQHPLMQAHQPDVIRIGRLNRIGGGLFKANLTFTDHSLADRLKGEYAVVTVRSVLRFFDQAGLLEKIQRIDLQGAPRRLAAPDLGQL